MGDFALGPRVLVPSRPLQGKSTPTCSFKKDGQLHAANAVGCVVLGDLNVHHRKWLKYSNRNSLEGQELCAFCKELGLNWSVSPPARPGAFWLPDVKAGVVPLIANHKPVNAQTLPCPHKSWPSARCGCSGRGRLGAAQDSLADT